MERERESTGHKKYGCTHLGLSANDVFKVMEPEDMTGIQLEIKGKPKTNLWETHYLRHQQRRLKTSSLSCSRAARKMQCQRRVFLEVATVSNTIWMLM